MVFGRQWVARIASILMTACFAAVNARNRRSVAGIMQLIKGIEIDFANKPDVFVYSQIILLSNLADNKQFLRRRGTKCWARRPKAIQIRLTNRQQLAYS
jgi:hypothetical protein